MKEEEEVRSVRYKEVELRGVVADKNSFFLLLEYYLDDVGGKYFTFWKFKTNYMYSLSTNPGNLFSS